MKVADNKIPVVLVVEDEILIQLQLTSMVEEPGYEVIEASNADEAIEILISRNDIRIVVTDIEMPGSMDGLKLAQVIRNRWPPVELIITSGRHRIGPDQLPTRGVFVPKPYDFDKLIPIIRRFAG